jgi:predicted nucleotidyltransferase
MSNNILPNLLTGILADFPDISLVYLFGSRVAGQIGPLSDYDLAILLDSLENKHDLQAGFQHAASLALKSDQVDVVVLNQAPIELAYHIIADGKILYQREALIRIEYEARVLGQYGDYLPVLRSQRAQILRGGEHDQRVQRYREAIGRTQRTLGPTEAPTRKESGGI